MWVLSKIFVLREREVIYKEKKKKKNQFKDQNISSDCFFWNRQTSTSYTARKTEREKKKKINRRLLKRMKKIGIFCFFSNIVCWLNKRIRDELIINDSRLRLGQLHNKLYIIKDKVFFLSFFSYISRGISMWELRSKAL